MVPGQGTKMPRAHGAPKKIKIKGIYYSSNSKESKGERKINGGEKQKTHKKHDRSQNVKII